MTTQPMTETAARARIRHLLDQPMMGFIPWIAVAVIEGPHRVVPAFAVALALAIATVVIGRAVDVKAKLLDLAAIGFFGVLVVVSALAGSEASRWLGDWSGELSSVMIALVTVGSILIRRPFTEQYARETTEREYWTSPLFLRINYAISGVWAGIFLVSAIIGYVGAGPLNDPNDVWTAWIVPIALIIVAIKFTAWYPAYATTDHPHGPGAGQHRHPSELLRPLALYLVPIGIVIMIVSSQLWWLGLIMILAGPALRRRLPVASAQRSTESN